jgi:hypothetical protein
VTQKGIIAVECSLLSPQWLPRAIGRITEAVGWLRHRAALWGSAVVIVARPVCDGYADAGRSTGRGQVSQVHPVCEAGRSAVILCGTPAQGARMRPGVMCDRE